jgi:hypothetical protein
LHIGPGLANLLLNRNGLGGPDCRILQIGLRRDQRTVRGLDLPLCGAEGSLLGLRRSDRLFSFPLRDVTAIGKLGQSIGIPVGLIRRGLCLRQRRLRRRQLPLRLADLALGV